MFYRLLTAPLIRDPWTVINPFYASQFFIAVFIILIYLGIISKRAASQCHTAVRPCQICPSVTRQCLADTVHQGEFTAQCYLSRLGHGDKVSPAQISYSSNFYTDYSFKSMNPSLPEKCSTTIFEYSSKSSSCFKIPLFIAVFPGFSILLTVMTHGTKQKILTLTVNKSLMNLTLPKEK